MIVEKKGNILNDNAQVLVCTTNTVGVMGKGVALAFKQKWPSILEPYKLDCDNHKLYAGDVKLYNLPFTLDMFNPELLDNRKWAAFCTKSHWRNPSEYKWIKNGLIVLFDLLIVNNYKTVAIPPLGCGNGGLDWNKVYPMIKEYYETSEIEARIYLPWQPN